jgi:hypothetical protein
MTLLWAYVLKAMFNPPGLHIICSVTTRHKVNVFAIPRRSLRLFRTTTTYFSTDNALWIPLDIFILF